MVAKGKAVNSPEDRGIITYNNVNYITATKENKNNKLKNAVFAETPELKEPINILSVRKLKEKIQKEEQQQMDNTEKLKIKEEQDEIYKNFIQIQEKQIQLKQQMEEVNKCVYNTKINLKDVEDNTNITIIAFKTLKGKFGDTYILIDDNYVCYWSIANTTAYINKLIVNINNNFTKEENIFYLVHNYTLQFILILEKNKKCGRWT